MTMSKTECKIRQSHNNDIHPSMLRDMEGLIEAGFDVRFDDTPDGYALSPIDQIAVDTEIADLERRTINTISETGVNPVLLPVGRTAFANWGPLTKRAIALKNIYEADTVTLGEGIDPNVYQRPLFSAIDEDGFEVLFSAEEVLKLQIGEEKANKIVGQYTDFIPTAIDDASRRIWVGARDGAGVRTRATCAMNEVTNHIVDNYPVGSEVVTASLACGAASPVLQLMQNLEAQGIGVKQAILADMDAMALASAYSLAERENVADKVSLKLENLVDMQTLAARDLTDFIEPGSVDVVDLLGLFEYFPRPLAISLLEQVKKVMRPGGIIVFGNMMKDRPQQTFFSDVSLWPPLEQRSLTEIFEIIEESGFNAKDDAKIMLPPQGVYAVVSIQIPQQA